MDTTLIKDQARKKARIEFEKRYPGVRFHRKESENHRLKHERVANCMVCGRKSDICICSGAMTEAAQDRFFQKRKEDEEQKASRNYKEIIRT